MELVSISTSRLLEIWELVDAHLCIGLLTKDHLPHGFRPGMVGGKFLSNME